ncbi:unnamed protein product, partial [Timema podura]|nr:unnamed protein product [Timema podura]
IGFQNKEKRVTDKVLLTAFELLKEPGTRVIHPPSNEDAVIISNNSVSQSLFNGTDGKIETPNVKKRHRRMKSSGMKNLDCDGVGSLTVEKKRSRNRRLGVQTPQPGRYLLQTEV